MRAVCKYAMIALCLGALSSPALAEEQGGLTIRSTGKLQHFLVKGYPEEAFERREQGEVGWTALVGNDGKVRECRIVESSGFEGLDILTCRLLTRFAKYDVSGPNHPRTVAGSVSWRLPDGMVPAQPAAAGQNGPPVNERCQIIQDIQWRTGGNRVCMSKEKWDRVARETQRELDEMRSNSFGGADLNRRAGGV